MAVTLNDLLNSVRDSRRHFLKHLTGLRDDQWDWKPYPECKSIRETLMHLHVDDKAALFSVQTNEEPDYEGMLAAAEMKEVAQLRAQLDESFETLLQEIQTRYADAPLDAEICIFGSKMKLAIGIPHLSAEDFYHAGQVAFIRMATDPDWNYYAAVYGAPA
jgi:uncharacterized damage-inducible protein DinB